MTPTPAPDVDTAIVLGMASTALPFADTREAEAERWLRILRMHGEAGEALQALGVSEAPLEASTPDAVGPPAIGGHDAREVIKAVTERAVAAAAQRGSRVVTAADVLMAVMDFYGEDFDRVLHVHGIHRDELLLRLEPLPAAGALN
jgi:hypothetical protein